MKRYVILTLVVVFGISILSTVFTYKKFNKESYNETSATMDITNRISNEYLNTSISNTSSNSILNVIEQPNITNEITQNNSEKLEGKNTTQSRNTNTKFSTPNISKTPAKTKLNVEKKKNNTPKNTNEKIHPSTNNSKQTAETKRKLGEEYKTNVTMINTIKSVINSNKSEDMKKYGYNIVVDSSIINQTSEFTYTQKRVIDKIKYKFSTIRIYARDYYRDGEFIETQCFIL